MIRSKINGLYILFIIIMMLNNFKSLCQTFNNVWPFGTSSINFSNFKGFAYGNSILDFSDIEPTYKYDSLMTLDFGGTTASICDSSGQLTLYTNGMQVHDGTHHIVKRGDTIAYSGLWEIFNVKDYPVQGQNWLAGLRSVQAALILPWPNDKDQYAILYHISTKNGSPNSYEKFAYTKVKVPKEDNSSVIYKDKTIQFNDFIAGMINACRHANGRDWWVVNRSIDRQYLFLYLFDPDGIRLYKKIKINIAAKINTDKAGQLYFSHQGDKLAIAESIIWPFEQIYVDVYDFDRSNGSTNLIMQDTLKNFAVHGTIAFSPNGDFLYASNHQEMFQYPLSQINIKAGRKKIAEFDGFLFKYNEFDQGNPTQFGCMAHGPDGRIYIVPESSNRFLHTIEFPDEEGEAASLVQRKIMLPTSNHVSVPNFPHYNLGPQDGSLADTLGIDNHPVARFRYVADTLNPLRVRFTDISYFRPEQWEWNFGDGTKFYKKKPYWHTFPSNGTYEVCLTVKNENSSNTWCRLITIGTSSSLIPQSSLDAVSVFPNPIHDYISITLHDYIPLHGEFILYDLLGHKVHSHKLVNGMNQVDAAFLKSGSYYYHIKDRHKIIKSGKLIKI